MEATFSLYLVSLKALKAVAGDDSEDTTKIDLVRAKTG